MLKRLSSEAGQTRLFFLMPSCQGSRHRGHHPNRSEAHDIVGILHRTDYRLNSGRKRQTVSGNVYSYVLIRRHLARTERR